MVSRWVPITDQGHLRVLGKALEETGELTAAMARCIIQGIDELEPVSLKPNRQWLMEEIADVYATLDMLERELELNREQIQQRRWAKFIRLAEWRALLEEKTPC